jgi:hypothetical protein
LGNLDNIDDLQVGSNEGSIGLINQSLNNNQVQVVMQPAVDNIHF